MWRNIDDKPCEHKVCIIFSRSPTLRLTFSARRLVQYFLEIKDRILNKAGIRSVLKYGINANAGRNVFVYKICP